LNIATKRQAQKWLKQLDDCVDCLCCLGCLDKD